MAECSSTSSADSESEDPFSELKLSSFEPLRRVRRALCRRCGSSRKYYCYTCYDMVGVDPRLIPRVRLPCKVDIIKHPGEVAGKSTATHARILAPDDVTIYSFPDIPNYPDPTKIVLVYPKDDALSTHKLAGELRQAEASLQPGGEGGEGGDGGGGGGGEETDSPPDHKWRSVDRVVFIDSTWQQTNSILKDEGMDNLPCVQISEQETHFWRPQKKSSSHLATIEAVYYFFRQMDPLLSGRQYAGQFDDLLYFYVHQYGVVQRSRAERSHSTDTL